MTETAGSREFTCAQCGAVVVVPPAQFIEQCPFCGSPRFGPAPVAAASPSLSALLPFELPPDRIATIYRQWLGTRLFRPHGVDQIAAGRLRAMYIPAWLCHATATSIWANAGDAADSGPASSGQHAASYPHVLISASRGLPANWLIHLGGFDLGQIRPMHQAAVRDHLLEIAAIDRDTALATARQQIETSERATCAALLPDRPAASIRVQTVIDDAAADLVELPLWLASFTFHGAHYRCLLNGQTGTVYGDAPVSGTKIAILIGIVILAIVAVLIVTQLYGS